MSRQRSGRAGLTVSVVFLLTLLAIAGVWVALRQRESERQHADTSSAAADDVSKSAAPAGLKDLELRAVKQHQEFDDRRVYAEHIAAARRTWEGR